MSQFHLLLPAMKFNVCPGPPNLSAAFPAYVRERVDPHLDG